MKVKLSVFLKMTFPFFLLYMYNFFLNPFMPKVDHAGLIWNLFYLNTLWKKVEWIRRVLPTCFPPSGKIRERKSGNFVRTCKWEPCSQGFPIYKQKWILIFFTESIKAEYFSLFEMLIPPPKSNAWFTFLRSLIFWSDIISTNTMATWYRFLT